MVEPNYKNKYPPIGLMKISTYFKQKGDCVRFHKGLLPLADIVSYDRVFITTLFTFDFDMCISTILYYREIVGNENTYVGGIAATIIPDAFIERIPNLQLLKGQLTSSRVLGYDDDINIDLLELDYDILLDVAYEYGAADSYFLYTTRGCPRKCSFCAVKSLEPKFYDCNNIEKQLKCVNSRFGVKHDLLIMDNNILYSKNLNKTVEDLCSLGFGVDNNKSQKNNTMKYYLQSLSERIAEKRCYETLLKRIVKEIQSIAWKRVSMADQAALETLIDVVRRNEKSVLIEYLLNNAVMIAEFFSRYNHQKITRHVDFNQGLDARLFTEEVARSLSKLAVKPCRIAFDDLSMKDDYFSAMRRAVKYGIRHFSNYMLYNYNDRPEDLWTRLFLNIQFVKEQAAQKIILFSFPMKYASIEHTDRTHIGIHWNAKYLRAMNVILNVTKGVVPKEEDFFIRAYGKNEEEYKRILLMPDDFIRHREYYDNIGLTKLWNDYVNLLCDDEIEALIDILSRMVDNPDVLLEKYTPLVDAILAFYTIGKKSTTKNDLYYSRKLVELKKLYDNYLNQEVG